MALRRIMKNAKNLTPQALRGGHGWDRPDVPLSIVPDYVHRREISIFDLNVWMYDGVYPEYFLSYNDIHLNDQFGAVKEMFKQAINIWAGMIFAGLFYGFFCSSRQQGIDYNEVNGSHNGLLLQAYQERKALKKNWLDLNLNGENGMFFCDYDRKGAIRKKLEKENLNAGQRKQINIEAKNFILKTIDEAKHKLAKKHKAH